MPPSTATSPACSASSGSTTRKSRQSASASIASITPRAFSSGSMRSTRCSRCARSCGRKMAFVQVGVPSRSKIDSYAAIEARIDERVAEINTRYGTERSGRADPLPEVGAQAPSAGCPLPARRLLHRQLAARRDEPRGEGVRRGTRGPGRRAGAQRDDRRGARADRRADHQPVSRRRFRAGDRAGDLHADPGAHAPHAIAAPGGGRA